ncbi:hypothetical protein [uncultured Marinobacter sp.]|uniref:hypothetical protein n=1 Tax=uncultured Marinobacter sp. TaxID=187379 RepID=UPI002637208A|nr:hypothetical protein [uncultured Marinobacter sp.]
MNKRIFLAAVAASVMASGQAYAQSGGQGVGASNFAYSSIGVSLGKATLDDSIILGGEVYEDLGLFAFGGSLQVLDNLVLLAGVDAIANDGRNSEVSQTSVSFGLSVPIPLGDRVDLVPSLGFSRAEFEICEYNYCVSDDDSFAVYGVGIRAWVVPSQFEISAGVASSNQEDSDSVVSLGAHGWLKEHHRIGLDYQDTDGISLLSLGYRYVF